MRIILDTVKRNIEVIEDTKLSDLLSFIDRNELDDYKIVSYKELAISKEYITYPTYPTTNTPFWYNVNWTSESITPTN